MDGRAIEAQVTVATRRVVQKRRLVDDDSTKSRYFDEETTWDWTFLDAKTSMSLAAFSLLSNLMSPTPPSPIASSFQLSVRKAKLSMDGPANGEKQKAERRASRPIHCKCMTTWLGHGLGDVFRRRSEKGPVRDEWGFGQEEGL